tara:strand:- start:2838 stop:3986 length:1149 start_codon:yes stop_codon:yes gene_type:complete
MGDDAGMMIGMMVLSIAAPYIATAIGPGMSAVGGVAQLAPAVGGGLTATTTGLSAMNSAIMGIANTSFMSSLMTGGTMALMGGMAGAMGQQPQMPDYSQQFGQMQGDLTQQQSYGRRGTSELEGILLTGSEFEKNQAFDELRRRGEDETKLLEMSGRSTRSAADQQALDEFAEKNAPPDASELELMAAQLQAERESGFARDLEAERTRLKQISASRGTLDSSRNREMNLRLAEIAAANRAELGSRARAEAVEFQTGIQDLQTTGYNRLLQGAGYAETQNRYNIELSEAERRYQESLRGAKNEDQRSLAFAKFQADLDRQLAVYNNEAAASRNKAMQQAGLLSIPLRAAFTPQGTTPAYEDLGFLGNQNTTNTMVLGNTEGDA